MYNVQHYFQILDKEKLIQTYMCEHPIEFWRLPPDSNLTIAEINEKAKNVLGNYIDRLRAIEPCKSEDRESVFYVYKAIGESGFDEPCFGLVYLDELVKNIDETRDYSYIFVKQEEIAGYLIADNERTQYFIYELMADIMFEASFFGFEQEDMEEEKEKLDKAMKEVSAENYKGIPAEDLFREMCQEYGLTQEPEYEDEKEVLNRAFEASNAYAQYVRKKELQILKSVILQEREGAAGNA